MFEFIVENYMWVKAFHIMCVIFWMAGMLYLPRLYVYHADAKKGSELSETFKVMERKLLRIIINPAMILTWIFGGLMIYGNMDLMSQGWIHIKLTMLVFMQLFHAFLAHWRRAFFKDENKRTSSFYRKVNEVPSVLTVIIVILAIIKPF